LDECGRSVSWALRWDRQARILLIAMDCY
jgi:hypothetical protein